MISPIISNQTTTSPPIGIKNIHVASNNKNPVSRGYALSKPSKLVILVFKKMAIPLNQRINIVLKNKSEGRLAFTAIATQPRNQKMKAVTESNMNLISYLKEKSIKRNPKLAPLMTKNLWILLLKFGNSTLLLRMLPARATTLKV